MRLKAESKHLIETKKDTDKCSFLMNSNYVLEYSKK